MSRFIEGWDRSQSTLFPERLDDWIGEDNPVRVVDVFVDQLDLVDLGFDRTRPASTGRHRRRVFTQPGSFPDQSAIPSYRLLSGNLSNSKFHALSHHIGPNCRDEKRSNNLYLIDR